MLKKISESEFSLSDVIVKGWSVYWQKIKDIAMIILFIHVPINIITYVLIANSLEDVAKVIKIVEEFIKGFVGMIAVMGIIVLVENTVNSDSVKIGWGAALKKAFFRWGSALGTSILAVLIISWPLFLLLIPRVVLSQYFFKEIAPMLFFAIPGIWGIYYGLCYIFIINVVTLHHVGGKTALNYSKSLVKWRWWKTLWVTIVLTLINIGLSFGVGYISSFLPDGNYIITDLFIQIVYAFSIVSITIFFLNLDYLSDRIKN